MSVTHLSGAVVRYKDRVIQRCAICGEKLIDNLRRVNTVVVSEEVVGVKTEQLGDAELGNMLVWREACLVQFDGNRQSDIGLYTEVDQVPDDFCLALVE